MEENHIWRVLNLIEFIEEASEDTDIGWWNENRRRLNEAIKYYNEYIEKDGKSRDIVLAKARQIRRYGEDHGFSDWQFDILNDIEERLGEKE